jgi:hypothetical protein
MLLCQRAEDNAFHLDALILENDAGDCVMFGVAERDQGRYYASLFGKCFGRYREDEERFAGRLFADADVAPTHRFADVIGW